MDTLRVAFLTPGFARDDGDTGCVPAIQDLALGLRNRSADITVFTLRYPHVAGTYLWRGQQVYAANGRTLRFPAILPSWARLAQSFARVMWRKPVHIVHSFWLGECAMLGECLSRCYGVPHVVTLMGQEVKGANPYFILLRSNRTVFVAVSQFQSRELLKRTGRNIHEVIPWGIEEPQLGADTLRDIDILGVGSLSDVKDFETFLDVVARVRESKPQLKCRIVGDGPRRAVLEEKTRNLGLAGTVQFDGRLPREAVLEVMHRTRVLLHTSKFESFGLVFAEALACGASIVSRPVGIFEAGPKWRVAEHPSGMCAAVLELLGKPDFSCRVHHPLENSIKAYLTLYRSLFGQRVHLSPAYRRLYDDG